MGRPVKNLRVQHTHHQYHTFNLLLPIWIRWNLLLNTRRQANSRPPPPSPPPFLHCAERTCRAPSKWKKKIYKKAMIMLSKHFSCIRGNMLHNICIFIMYHTLVGGWNIRISNDIIFYMFHIRDVGGVITRCNVMMPLFSTPLACYYYKSSKWSPIVYLNAWQMDIISWSHVRCWLEINKKCSVNCGVEFYLVAMWVKLPILKHITRVGSLQQQIHTTQSPTEINKQNTFIWLSSLGTYINVRYYYDFFFLSLHMPRQTINIQINVSIRPLWFLCFFN